VKWFRLAAAQGHAGAQCDLGAAFLNGEGVNLDNVEAVKWFRLAAEMTIYSNVAELSVFLA
jgi:TPR repeat protein